MPDIAVGHFDDCPAAERALRALADAGFAPTELVTFAPRDPEAAAGGAEIPAACADRTPTAVAVRAADSGAQERALLTLVVAGARAIETADGAWSTRSDSGTIGADGKGIRPDATACGAPGTAAR